jgi:hypothetical protein
MPNRSSNRGKGKKDINQLAYDVVREALAETPPKGEEESSKNRAAVTLGRLGGLKGGKARADALTAAQRKAIAKKAAIARWKK